jgi:hypothetical protein
MTEIDQRIEAWEVIAKHPIFAPCYAETDPLLTSMMRLLDGLLGARTSDTDAERRRAEVAWILWCASEGYLTGADRAVVENWFLSDPANDHPEDNRGAWLEMADAVLAALQASADSGESS